MLLILTSNTDLTADFLITELIRRGLPYFRLNIEDLAKASFTFSLDNTGIVREIQVGSRTANFSDVNAVWYRRAVHPYPGAHLSVSERYFIGGELRHLTLGMALNPDITWVNPIANVSVAEQKLYQLRVASSLGFSVPRTIVSRDSRVLQEFMSKLSPRGCVCKPIFHGLFTEGAARYSIYTRRISIESLGQESVEICPIMLQEEIPRIADVRATFIGDEVFVADISASGDVIDWRRPNNDIRYAASVLPNNINGMCRNLLRKLGLIYGAFDFIRTPAGELVFLEVNPTGEWAWLENELGFPMREAFIQVFYGR